MLSSRNSASRSRRRTKIPKQRNSPYDVKLLCATHWTPGSEVPAFCSHTAHDCSKQLCADVGRDLKLPPRLFLHSKQGSHRHEKSLQRTCPYFLADSPSISRSGVSTHNQKQNTVVPATKSMTTDCTLSQSRRPKSCPSQARLHQSGYSQRKPSEQPSSRSRIDRKELLTERSLSLHLKQSSQLSQTSRTKQTPQSMFDCFSLSQGISRLAQRRQRSSYSSSVVLESKLSKASRTRPSSAVSAYNGNHYSLSADSSDDVFIRLSKPKFSFSSTENNLPTVPAKRQRSTVSIELFERLSMPKVVPEQAATISNRRDSRPVKIELFERLAQPKSRNSRSSSVFSQSLDAPEFSHHLESRSTNRQSSWQSGQRNNLAVRLMPRSSSSGRRHTDITNCSHHYTGLLTSNTILEEEENYMGHLLPQRRSLNAMDVTREASDLLSSFRQTVDSFDDLCLLSLEDDTDDERDVFLSSMDRDVFLSSLDSGTPHRSASETIKEEDEELEDNPTQMPPQAQQTGSLALDVEDILKSAEMLLCSTEIEAKEENSEDLSYVSEDESEQNSC